MKVNKYNMYLKVSSIVIIAVLLLIPTGMITNLIHEREAVQKEAIEEVSSKWGDAQTLTGPFISIPYYKFIKQSSNNINDDGKIVRVKDYIHILPTELKLNGDLQPNLKNRGIHEIVVYNTNIHVAGYFEPINLNELDIPLENIRLSDAVLTTGITDLRGVKEQVQLKWNDTSSLFNPGVVSNDVVKSGINAPINLQNSDSLKHNFSFNLELKGSEYIYFTPVGKNTELAFKSPWKHPKFTGAFLPDTSDFENGFASKWKILHLNRNYPQMWTGPQYEIGSSAFGIDLFVPVDNYQKSFRASKYAILFIAFTFIAFFFIEVMNKVFIHPIQYILVGIALVVFYTLLLSLSEHIAFNFAFLISSLATILLVAGYVRAILGHAKFALLISGILFLMYSFIFVIIQLQDFALLFGSIGVFVILAIVMYVSRKIDWYSLNPDINIKKEVIEGN